MKKLWYSWVSYKTYIFTNIYFNSYCTEHEIEKERGRTGEQEKRVEKERTKEWLKEKIL